MKRLILLIVVALTMIGAQLPINNRRDVSVTADSAVNDSTLGSGVIGLGPINDYYRGLTGWIVIGDPTSSLRGLGLSDSAVIRLRTSNGTVDLVVAADSVGSTPCTLIVAVANTGDTLFKDEFYFEWATFDTTGDTTTHEFSYPISWKLTFR